MNILSCVVSILVIKSFLSYRYINKRTIQCFFWYQLKLYYVIILIITDLQRLLRWCSRKNVGFPSGRPGFNSLVESYQKLCRGYLNHLCISLGTKKIIWRKSMQVRLWYPFKRHFTCFLDLYEADRSWG